MWGTNRLNHPDRLKDKARFNGTDFSGSPVPCYETVQTTIIPVAASME